MRSVLVMFLSLAAFPAAGDFSLVFPLDCTLDENCYIQQFVDHDPSQNASDFQCGSLTYDGHKGTDFALSTLADQATGVAVLAAATGEVRGIRNHISDVLQGTENAPNVDDIECGNGVLLRHSDGWETQYCHMAQGSITVAVGDAVTAGDTLGFVGLSGQTQFPHLHLSVRHNGVIIDPFHPDGRIACNTELDDTLWEMAIPTPAGGIITSGFATKIPEFYAVKAGTAGETVISTTANVLIFWGFGFGTQKGDVMELRISGPDGFVFENRSVLDRTQAQMFRAGGKRAPSSGFATGVYDGNATLQRDGKIIDIQQSQLRITN